MGMKRLVRKMKLKLESESRQYQVIWEENDRYDQVYLHIEPLKPVKRVQGDELKLDTDLKNYI